MSAHTLAGIARALRGEVNSGRYVLAPGPGHSPRDRSMQVSIDDSGVIRVHSFSPADSWQDCRDYVLRILGEPDWRDRDQAYPVPWSPPAPRIETPDDRAKADRDARFTAATLAGSRPSTGSPVEVYLRWRGCWVAEAADVLRYHPGLRHPSGATVPAMLAPITDAVDAGRTIGLHLTALTVTGEGKEEVAPRKWMRGRVAGGVVRLIDDAEVTHGLGIAEGIETALAVMVAGWRPVWAALSAGTMASLPPLPPLTLSVFADRDRAGMAAAEKVVDRWRAAGLEAATAAPPAGDWADIREGNDHA